MLKVIKRIWGILAGILGTILGLIGKLIWKGIVFFSGILVFMYSLLFFCQFIFRITSFDDTEFLPGFLVYVPSIIVLIINFGYKRRCPACHKWFVMKRSGDELVKCKDIQIKAEVKTKNKMGEVIGTQEQYVPGTRKIYHRNYVCRKCGETSYETYSKDVKNT